MTIAEEKQAQRAAGRAARKALDAPQRASFPFVDLRVYQLYCVF